MLVKADIIDEFLYVWFDYNPRLVEQIKKVPGFRFVGVNKPHGPAWRAPLEFETCKQLYAAMKDEEIRISPKLKQWGLERRKQSTSLVDLGAAKDVELEIVPQVLPDLMKNDPVSGLPNLRPSQKVLAKFVAVPGSNPIIGDQPGTGKTRGTIAGVCEAGLLDGFHLVTAPRTALNTVWLRELSQWQPHPVFVAQRRRDDRETILDEMTMLYEMGEPFWLVVNPQMIALRRQGYDETTGEEILAPNYPEIHGINWTTVIADEVHKSAVQNPQALTAKAYYRLNTGKRIAMSGTPLGGQPIKLWGILHWLHPQEFKSKWRFADQWMTIDEVQTKKGTFKKVGKIRKSREEDFQKFIAPYLLRRTKREIAEELPPVGDPVDIWVDMTPKQAARYKQMALEAEIKIEDDKEAGVFSATSILAEYTRLKQFANAYCDIGPMQEDGRRPVIPTSDSGKIPALMELLEERGITKDEYDDPAGEKVIVFSQFTQFINMLAKYLEGQGLPCWTITGETKDRDRQKAQDDFQRYDGGKRLILMNVNAGGTAITLDRADTVVFMDETWNPDDQTQGIDRAHRISRIHNVTPYFIRAKDSIEDYIMRVCKDKSAVNDMILDLWREGFRAIQ